jgi:hypothetical protein
MDTMSTMNMTGTKGSRLDLLLREFIVYIASIVSIVTGRRLLPLNRLCESPQQ